jgi:hypothetical protein
MRRRVRPQTAPLQKKKINRPKSATLQQIKHRKKGQHGAYHRLARQDVPTQEKQKYRLFLYQDDVPVMVYNLAGSASKQGSKHADD